MKHITTPGTSAGFALTEALVSILLLAIAMLAAGAGLADSIAGQRAALLQTRATDLAANLAEALRTAPDAAAFRAEVESWQAAAARVLPQAEAFTRASADQPDRLDIHLQWRNGKGLRASHFLLPVTIPLGAT